MALSAGLFEAPTQQGLKIYWTLWLLCKVKINQNHDAQQDLLQKHKSTKQLCIDYLSWEMNILDVYVIYVAACDSCEK